MSFTKRKKLQRRLNAFKARKEEEMRQATPSEPAPMPVCLFYLRGCCTKVRSLLHHFVYYLLLFIFIIIYFYYYYFYYFLLLCTNFIISNCILHRMKELYFRHQNCSYYYSLSHKYNECIWKDFKMNTVWLIGYWTLCRAILVWNDIRD